MKITSAESGTMLKTPRNTHEKFTGVNVWLSRNFWYFNFWHWNFFSVLKTIKTFAKFAIGKIGRDLKINFATHIVWVIRAVVQHNFSVYCGIFRVLYKIIGGGIGDRNTALPSYPLSFSLYPLKFWLALFFKNMKSLLYRFSSSVGFLFSQSWLVRKFSVESRHL